MSASNALLTKKIFRIMKLGKKKMMVIIAIIYIVLLAAYLGLREAGIIGEGWSWLFIVIVGAAVVAVELIRKRVDPETYRAWRADLKKRTEEYEDIKSLKIKRTIGGTICEFITALLLIVFWMLFFHKQMYTYDYGIILGILSTAGAIWCLVSAYSPRFMIWGYKITTVKQLQLGIYRKRALAIVFAVFLLPFALPYTDATIWIFLVFAILLFILDATKYYILKRG